MTNIPNNIYTINHPYKSLNRFNIYILFIISILLIITYALPLLYRHFFIENYTTNIFQQNNNDEIKESYYPLPFELHQGDILQITVEFKDTLYKNMKAKVIIYDPSDWSIPSNTDCPINHTTTLGPRIWEYSILILYNSPNPLFVWRNESRTEDTTIPAAYTIFKLYKNPTSWPDFFKLFSDFLDIPRSQTIHNMRLGITDI